LGEAGLFQDGSKYSLAFIILFASDFQFFFFGELAMMVVGKPSLALLV
jgi:hypothetical protein